MVTNDAARTPNGELSRVALLKNGWNIAKLFSPEHGISVRGEDGIFQKSGTDEHTKLPVISLYGAKMAPNEEDFANSGKPLDAILFDIPDVGCRFYTYLWTMTFVMEACAQHGVLFILADSPNPIGAEIFRAEGPWLNEEFCSSFIGRWNIPLKHCCTLGELCQYFAQTRLPSLNFAIIPVKNYKRGQNGYDFNFIPTSPAITDVETAMLYPGTGLLEGINVNEGRGTPVPFKKFGSPWLKNQLLLEKLQNSNLPGVTFNKTSYIPENGPYSGEVCNGLMLHILQESIFEPVKTGILLIKSIIQLHADQIEERLYRTHANPTGESHLDKLMGVPGSFNKLKLGEKIQINVAEQWEKVISRYLLY